MTTRKQTFDFGGVEFQKTVRKATFGRVVLFASILSLMLSTAWAKPVTYTGFTISDGKLGSWSFHNARVYLTLQSDTNNANFTQIGGVDVWINQTGTAYVTVISGSKAVTAQFAANQIFVSVDLGDTINAPHIGGRGIGFGSMTSSFEPAYPLGIEDGTIDWGDITNGTDAVESPGLDALAVDLSNNTGFSGRALSCVGFPDPCAAALPLKTDHGDFYLYSPYADQFPGFLGDSLNAGFFTTHVGEYDTTEPPEPPHIKGNPVKSANPITYYGYVIADVTLGRNQYSGAQVYLSMDADASTVVPFGSGHGFKNATGAAHVTIVDGTHAVSADFNPGQIYVYYDVDHASVGFGSTAPGTESGYPLSITAHQDDWGLVENSTVGAVSDLTLTPADASNYTAATASLVTDLKNATALSGGASSCLGFNPATSTCSTLTPIPLKTSRGDFSITEPYRQDAIDPFATTYTVNWGVFWSQPGPKHGD